MGVGAVARLDHRRHAQVVAGRACLSDSGLDLLADVVRTNAWRDPLYVSLTAGRDRLRGLAPHAAERVTVLGDM